MHAGNGVHNALDQSLVTCTIPSPLPLTNVSTKGIECSLDHLSSVLAIKTTSSTIANIHFLAHVGQSFNFKISLEDRLPPLRSSNRTLRILAPSNGRYATLCCACVHMHDDAHNFGYLAHPAVVDNCFHIGAMVAAYNSKASAMSTYVPIGLSAFSVFASFESASGVYAFAEVKSNNDVLSALSSYHMTQSRESMPCGFQANDLQAQAVHLGQSLNKESSKQAMNKSYTYIIQWQNCSPSKSHPPKECLLQNKLGYMWLDNFGKRVLGETTQDVMSAAMSFLKDIALIQTLLVLPLSGQHVIMMSTSNPLYENVVPSDRTVLPIHGVPSRSNFYAACLGLVKVAAAEHPEHIWGSVMADSLSCGMPTFPKNVDPFGQIISRRATIFPRMLVTLPQLGSSLMYRKIAVGKTTISGGLNGALCLPMPFELLVFVREKWARSCTS